MRDDLRWFVAILSVAGLNRVPLRHFTESDTPFIELTMDASDQGLCVAYAESFCKFGSMRTSGK